MTRILLANLSVLAIVLGTAPAAHAVSLTIDPGHGVFLPPVGSTVTVTVTLDTTGAPAAQIAFVELGWNPAVLMALNPTPTFTLGSSSQVITSGLNVGVSNLTSLDGAVPWLGPAVTACDLSGPGAGSQCTTINQTVLSPFAPDPAILVSTLELQVLALGSAGLHVVAYDAFGATPVFVPEPATAALLGLSLVGLAAARRRVRSPDQSRPRRDRA